MASGAENNVVRKLHRNGQSIPCTDGWNSIFLVPNNFPESELAFYWTKRREATLAPSAESWVFCISRYFTAFLHSNILSPFALLTGKFAWNVMTLKKRKEKKNIQIIVLFVAPCTFAVQNIHFVQKLCIYTNQNIRSRNISFTLLFIFFFLSAFESHCWFPPWKLLNQFSLWSAALNQQSRLKGPPRFLCRSPEIVPPA